MGSLGQSSAKAPWDSSLTLSFYRGGVLSSFARRAGASGCSWSLLLGRQAEQLSV